MMYWAGQNQLCQVVKFKWEINQTASNLSVIFYRFSYYELAKDIKHNKGGILRASVIYVRILKSDLLKKQRLEEICNNQHERLSLMFNKIRVGTEVAGLHYH